MKTKKWIFASAIMMLTACSSQDGEESVFSGSPAENETEVTMNFSPYDVEAMTRATTSISEVVTRLDVWIYESGNEFASFHQSSSDDGFGSISVTLNKTKTYTLYAVGHKAAGAATLADGVISFPDDKVTHSMYYTQTFSPSTTTNINALMQRIVAQFQFTTTDVAPAAATKMTFTLAGVYNRWNVSTGATNSLDRTSTFNNFSKNANGTVTFNIYAIVTDAQTLHTVTVKTYDANDQELQSRTFNDVPLRNGYRTTYTGVYFTDTPTAATFSVGDWEEFAAVNF